MMPTDRNEPTQSEKLAVLHNDILVQAQRERMPRLPAAVERSPRQSEPASGSFRRRF
jgi:hypothetical protein